MPVPVFAESAGRNGVQVNMRLFVKVKPKARKEKIEKIDEVHYCIWVKDPAEKGKANKRVIKLLADYFSVSQSRIVIVSGFKSSTKVVSF